MLVLTRKVNESIQAGDVTITIVRLGASNVRIGIEAPADVRVARTELLEGLEPSGVRRQAPELAAAEAAA